MPTLKVNHDLTTVEYFPTLNCMEYYLNGVRVFVGYNGRFVSIDGVMFESEPLIEFATDIATKPPGTIKLDTWNNDIMNFLKLTKCLLYK